MKKGLTCNDLMVLKRIGDAESEGTISRQASGMCVDFPKDDPTVYFVGTENNTIHKCSCSYNEQYLENYFGHAGPVYKVKCSPFAPQVFLSCSADWTVKLWNQKDEKPLLSFMSVNLTDVVHDIAWSPSSGTVFGYTTGDGRIELWDLMKNTLDPVVTHAPEPTEWEEEFDEDEEELAAAAAEGEAAAAGDADADGVPTLDPAPHAAAAAEGGAGGDEQPAVKSSLSCLAFSRNAPVLVVGDANGSVHVFNMLGMAQAKPGADGDVSPRPGGKDAAQEQAERLKSAIMQTDAQ